MRKALVPLVVICLGVLLAAASRDLGRDEQMGGHTLARHVGRTDAQLRERLEHEPQIAAASTYEDRATAERVVGEALARSASRLDAWRARQGRRPNLTVRFKGDGRPIGRSLERGRRSPTVCSDAVVVLGWDERRNDYSVLTSYPEARR
jgi:hypothetical protein